MLRAEDSPVRALMTQVDDCFREWYAFFADAMLVQGGMSLMQFMRYVRKTAFFQETALTSPKICTLGICETLQHSSFYPNFLSDIRFEPALHLAESHQMHQRVALAR